MRWNLDALYSSFESEEYLSDFQKLDTILEDFDKWARENLSSQDNLEEKLESYINFSRRITFLFNKLTAFASLSVSTNARDDKALQYLDRLSLKGNNLTKPQVQFQNFIRDISDLDSLIEKSDLLKEHGFYLNQIKESSKYLLSQEEEYIISKLRNTSSTAWSNLQDKITSTLLVDIEMEGEDKSLPLPMVRNLAYDRDPAIRKKAYEAELKAYEKIDESSAAALNSIKGEVISLAELRGFDSPLHETLFKSRMDQDILNALIESMEDFLPVFHRYYKRKAQILKHENGLPFYDLFAPLGQVNMTFSYEEAINYIVENFKSFSPRLAKYVEDAYGNSWLDVEPREGKRGGAFCANLHPIGESRILSNFDGSFSSMITLAHELGHGYHGLNLRNESILNSRYPMPIAETASIFCETIVTRAALKDASQEEALAILEASISDAGQVIVDIYSRFLFESQLFDKRRDRSLSVEELKEIMIDSQKKAYGPGLDQDLLHPYMWLNKSHYYSAGLNFYNFPYAFGLLFAKGLYARYLLKGQDFVEEYDRLLQATGKHSIRDIGFLMDIDLSKPDFFRSSLDLIREDIEEFLKLTDK